MPARKRHYNNLLKDPLHDTSTDGTTALKHNETQPEPLKTKADIFISALLYGALERI